MPILNIELIEYDALRNRVNTLEAEKKTLQEIIDSMAEDGRLRVVKKTVTVDRNPFKWMNEHLLDHCTEKYEFLNFEDTEAEAKSQFYKDMANRTRSDERQEINRLNEENGKLSRQLDDARRRIDLLLKRGLWARIRNKGVKEKED